ncbi:MAG: bifunctional phosphoserine phosphatase/homoserine phosphotransferase ThrH [Deltaproteobacteria bacterium]|nr:bifunctional phosphoserine phosphatase/homoserine phosphotransferase ThrH [Deltaproteobacteria bacterium]MBW2340355.1 bifunctional phosphoserine phosphatase/homoserine phosphotransferase ThrH [Deltaproteobacteria bacterium]
MYVVCPDLEGILVPEIWISVAEKTGIEELHLTTRDVPDYDQLMRGRIEILKRVNLKIGDIQEIIQSMEPLDGALEFLEWTREGFQIILVSDTFVEFADPLLEKLNRPTLFCNSLIIDADGTIADYQLRQRDGKRHVVEALRGLGFEVIGIGDSYNDSTMLEAANHGILFRPPQNIKDEFRHFPVIETYEELKLVLEGYLRRGY